MKLFGGFLLLFTLLEFSLAVFPSLLKQFKYLTEGSSMEIRLVAGSAFSCLIQIESEFSKQIEIYPSKVSSADGSERILILKALADDKKEEDIHSAEFLLVCGNKMKRIKQYLIDDNENILYNDPNFIQPITDVESGNVENICYLFRGEAGKFIEIYRDSESFTAIQGKFAENNLFSTINIQSTNGSLSINQNDILLNKKVILRWDNLKPHKSFKNDFCEIQLDGNSIHISSSRKQVFNNRHFSINKIDTKNGNFLEFRIGNLQNYKHIEGLLGTIGNNRFTFYKSVKMARKNERGMITVNGHFMTTIKLQKSKLKCWLIDVRNLIHPSSRSNNLIFKEKYLK